MTNLEMTRYACH